MYKKYLVILLSLFSLTAFGGDSESFSFTDDDGNTHNVTVDYGKNGRIKKTTDVIDMADGSTVTTTTKTGRGKMTTTTTIEPAQSQGGSQPRLPKLEPKALLKLENEGFAQAGGFDELLK